MGRLVSDTRDPGITYLAQQLINVPMMLRYTFDELIKSSNEISNLTAISVMKDYEHSHNLHLRNRDRNFVTRESLGVLKHYEVDTRTELV